MKFFQNVQVAREGDSKLRNYQSPKEQGSAQRQNDEMILAVAEDGHQFEGVELDNDEALLPHELPSPASVCQFDFHVVQWKSCSQHPQQNDDVAREKVVRMAVSSRLLD